MYDIDDDSFDHLIIGHHDYYMSDSSSDEEEDDSIIYRTDTESIDDLVYSDDDEDESESGFDTEIIFEQNMDYLDEPKVNGQYCVGLCKQRGRMFMLANSIDPKIFLRCSHDIALQYLVEYSGLSISNPEIDIVKIRVLRDGTYVGVKKTFWIRWIQRKWRAILQRRTEIMWLRTEMTSLRHFALTGRYPHGMNVLPGLSGMLRYIM